MNAEHEVNIIRQARLEDESIGEIIRRCAVSVLRAEGMDIPCQIDVFITDDERIRKLNCEHRGVDRETDVLSFPMADFFDGEAREDLSLMRDPDSGALFLGDVVLSAERIDAQSREYGHSVLRECAFLTVHAVLHLLGYDHEDGEARGDLMRAREKAALSLSNAPER